MRRILFCCKFKINLLVSSSLNDRNKKLNASIEAKTKVRTWFGFCPSSKNDRNKFSLAFRVKDKLRKDQKQVSGLADLQLVRVAANHVGAETCFLDVHKIGEQLSEFLTDSSRRISVLNNKAEYMLP